MKYLITLIILIMTSSLKAQNNSCNCCTEKHSEFDFWVGSWSVTNPDGTPAGTNSIEKIHQSMYKSWFETKNMVIFE